MPFGEVLADFDFVELETADGKLAKFKNSFLTRTAFRIIGIPHLEMRIRARKILSFLPKKGGKKRLLDAGCGPGIYSLTLLKRDFIIDAVDIDEKKMKFFREKSGKSLTTATADITKLPFRKESFDFIICSDVIEHIKDDKKAFLELSRVLKKKGVLVLSVPAISKKNLQDWKRFHHERPGYNLEMIRNLAKMNGLRITGVRKYSGKLVEKAFKINEMLYSHGALLGILFYPLYLTSYIEDALNLHRNQYNGIAVGLIKDTVS